MFIIPQASGRDFDERTVMLFIVVGCIFMYSCVTVTYADDRGGVMADSLPPPKETGDGSSHACVFQSVEPDRERIVVGDLIYIVHFWYWLDTNPISHSAYVYDKGIEVPLFLRSIVLTLDQIEGLRKQRTDPDTRVGSGAVSCQGIPVEACSLATRVILVSEVAKKEDVNSGDDK